MYINIDLCKKCGGKCCKMLPGAFYPQQLKGDMKESLINLLDSGFTFDSWFGDPRNGLDEFDNVFFLRPKTTQEEGAYNESWGGVPCIFLKDNGCSFAENDRPLGCQILEPGEGKCESHTTTCNDKQDCAIAWIPFQDIIKELLE